MFVSASTCGAKRPREDLETAPNFNMHAAVTAAAPQYGTHHELAAMRIAELEAQLAQACSTIQQQETELFRLRTRVVCLEDHLRGTYVRKPDSNRPLTLGLAHSPKSSVFESILVGR